MKVPNFMKQERLSFSASKKAFAKFTSSPKHTPLSTECKATSTSTNDNRKSLDIIYNMTNTTINVPKVICTLSPKSIIKNMTASARFTKSAQPKRLKRNRLTINKLKNDKQETPVRAYLRARESMLNVQPQKLVFKEQEETEQEENVNTPSTVRTFKQQLKSSFSQLTKLVSKSRLSIVKSPNDSTHSSNSCSNKSDTCSPIQQEYKRFKSQVNINNHISKANSVHCISGCSRSNRSYRPIMGITALMLDKYNKKSNSTTSGLTNNDNVFMTNVSWPNVYLIGLPIVFNSHNNHINNDSNKSEIKQATTPMLTKQRQSNVKLELCNDNFDTFNCIL